MIGLWTRTDYVISRRFAGCPISKMNCNISCYLEHWYPWWENDSLGISEFIQQTFTETVPYAPLATDAHFKWWIVWYVNCCLLFSFWVVSDSLRPHGLRHARLPCPSLSPRVCSSACPLSRWCYLTISSSVTPFTFCLQSFPASGLFQWVGSWHQVTNVLELQHQSFQWIFSVDLL